MTSIIVGDDLGRSGECLSSFFSPEHGRNQQTSGNRVRRIGLGRRRRILPSSRHSVDGRTQLRPGRRGGHISHPDPGSHYRRIRIRGGPRPPNDGDGKSLLAAGEFGFDDPPGPMPFSMDWIGPDDTRIVNAGDPLLENWAELKLAQAIICPLTDKSGPLTGRSWPALPWKAPIFSNPYRRTTSPPSPSWCAGPACCGRTGN